MNQNRPLSPINQFISKSPNYQKGMNQNPRNQDRFNQGDSS